MGNKQNSQSIIAWQKENTELIRIHARKDEHISDRIAQAHARKDEHISDRIAQAVAQGKDKSRQAYILNAVRARLDADGFPTPEPENDKAQPGE